MQEKELMEFVLWLPKNIEAFQGMSAEEVVAKLNVMEKAGDDTLEELIKAFKSSKTTFKLGGKLDDIKKFQLGGLTRRQAIDAYMQNNEGVTRRQARQAYRSARAAANNIDRDALRTDGYANRRDWARRLIVGVPSGTSLNTLPEMNQRDHSMPMSNQLIPALIEREPKPFVSSKTLDLVQTNLLAPNLDPTPASEYNSNSSEYYKQHTPDFKLKGSFNSAFKAARNAGLETFGYKGGVYGTRYATENNEQWKKNLEGIRNKLMVKQDGGTINTPNGPIFETDEGYVDSNGRSVNYQPSKISQWLFDRDLQRKWENDALSQASIDGKVILDMFDNQPWKDMNRAAGKNPQMEIDTIVVRTNDDGSEDRERARSFKTFWSRKIFGDSKFDKMNRQYEKEASK